MTTQANQRQIPENAILDFYNKQNYLGNSFVASSGAITLPTAATESPIITLANPSTNGVPASGFQVQNTGLFLKSKKLLVLTATQSCVFKIYIGPTITVAGTVVTPVNMRPANSNASVMSFRKSPTIGANGTLLTNYYSNGMVIDDSFLFVLDPNKTILITGTPSANSTVVTVDLNWYEW